MTVFWRGLFRVLCTFVLVSMKFVECNRQTTDVSIQTTLFTGDFENFLKGLGSMVYNKYKKPFDRRRFRHEYLYTTTKPTKISRRDDLPFINQKEAVRDALMMKLVSYYENKYKITQETTDHTPPTTQEPPTTDEYDEHYYVVTTKPTTLKGTTLESTIFTTKDFISPFKNIRKQINNNVPDDIPGVVVM